MAFTEKKYVDLAGLTTFRDSLKTKLAANSASDWTINYASNAGSATKATQDGDGNVITSTYLTVDTAQTTYVPLTRTIAGKALNADISASDFRTAINVEDGSEKNIIETISIDGVDQTPDGNRNVALNLSAYAKKTDITAVLKFMGVKGDISELPTASADQVGHVYIIATGNDKDAYAEYVCVDKNGETEGGYAWEKLGNGTALVDYYTKDEIDAKITAMSLAATGAEGSFISAVSQTNGKVSASATAFASTVAESGTIAPTAGAVYTAIESAKSALMGTGASDVTSTIKKNEAAIAVLNGVDTAEGSVAKKIKDAIDALDGTQTAGDYVTAVTQTDGKVSVTRANKGSVADKDTGLVDGGTVYSALTAQIASAIADLDVAEVGGDGKFLSAISEADGKISATVKSLDTAIGDNPSTVVAPTSSAVKAYADGVYAAFGSVTEAEIQGLFA